MSSNLPTQPAQPSWRGPIAAGALVTTLLHVPALTQHEIWLPLCCCAPVLGAPLGLLPATLALRRDPYMGAASGFSVAFISIGLGALIPAATTLLRGYRVNEDMIAQMREAWTEQGLGKHEVDQAIDYVLTAGPLSVVVSAALLALAAGVMGAILAGWTDRRRRRSAQPPKLS